MALGGNVLQAQFSQPYLCIDDTSGWLLHAWRSFHFAENA